MVTSTQNICIKLKGEVGMAVPKSNQTRVVGIITYLVHPYACFQVTACMILKFLLLFSTYYNPLIIIWMRNMRLNSMLREAPLVLVC